jgi:hypothetical protein
VVGRFVLVGSLGALLALDIATQAARADGGAVRYSEQHGNVLVTVFTAPTPLRAGPVDISVLIQDAESKLPLTNIPISIRAELIGDQGGPTRSLSARATSEAATNKLMRAADLDLSPAGRWRIEIEPQGVGHDPPIQFDVDVAEGFPPWAQTSLWVGWPLLAIGGFALHQWRIQRRRESAATGPPAARALP